MFVEIFIGNFFAKFVICEYGGDSSGLILINYPSFTVPRTNDETKNKVDNQWHMDLPLYHMLSAESRLEYLR